MGRGDDTAERYTPQERITDEEAKAFLEAGTPGKIVERLQPLIISIIRRHTMVMVTDECYADVLQEGNIGCMEATKSWKYGKGASIGTWSYQYIKRHVLREVDRQYEFYRHNVTTDYSESYEDEDASDVHPSDAAYGEAQGAGERAMEWTAEYERIAAVLYPRDRLILDYLRDGFTVREIAEFLGVSIGSAQNDIANVKFVVKNIEQNLNLMA